MNSIRLKKRIYEIIEPGSGKSLSHCFDIFIIVLILFNILSVILESVASLYSSYRLIFEIFETVSVIIFSVEYVLRVWTCTLKEKYSHPLLGRIKYMFSFMLLIDLIAILPFYLPFIVTVDMRFIRILRLFRITRLFKLGRYSRSMQQMKAVLKEKKEELAISMFAGLILLVLSACLVYYAEKDAQPEAFSSIPMALWWAVCTLTTVGYGDIYPITVWGRIIATFISILGIGLLALPAGIFASGFSEQMEKRVKKGSEDEEATCCPHCGKEI